MRFWVEGVVGAGEIGLGIRIRGMGTVCLW
jgi:hypothetical protein